MVSKEFTYKKAFERKRLAVKERDLNREVMLSAAYTSQPRLAEIDDSLKELGARLALTVLSGDKEKVEYIKAECKKLSLEKETLLKKAMVPPESFFCDLCKDTGYVRGKICNCIKREAAKVMVEELSREMPLSDCRFDNFDLKYYSDKTDSEGNNPRRRMTSIFKLCREYVMTFSPETSKNLLFTGSAGLGKTHLTLAIVSGVIEKGYFPIYGSAENLFSAIEYEKFSGEGRDSYDTMLCCDLLVIDDLGAEMTTSFTKSVLYNLVNTRLLTKRPTIINTNLTMREIEERYSPRISSRLIGNYDANKFLGNDIRQQKLLRK
ncbi:MAG: ATP-binding protein [Acutalibacteraceae bacterium]|jgi:DNA replication protein DnaC